MLFNYKDYRTLLRACFDARTLENPDYSLRAFAQDLDLTHAAFSQVFKGVRNFSEETALQIADKLGLSREEKDYFHALVLAETSRIKEEREENAVKAEQLRERANMTHLPPDMFRTISEWYYLPIMALTSLRDFSAEPAWIAQRLGIGLDEAKSAFERLRKLGILKQDPKGRWRQEIKYMISPEGGADVAKLVEQFKQFLKLASAALTSQSSDERVSGSETISLPAKHFEKARLMTEEYFRKISSLDTAHTHVPGDDVYHLQVHFFRLTTPIKK